MQIDHIVVWYATVYEVYREAADIGIATAHIAEFYFARWYDAFAEALPRGSDVVAA